MFSPSGTACKTGLDSRRADLLGVRTTGLGKKHHSVLFQEGLSMARPPSVQAEGVGADLRGGQRPRGIWSALAAELLGARHPVLVTFPARPLTPPACSNPLPTADIR